MESARRLGGTGKNVALQPLGIRSCDLVRWLSNRRRRGIARCQSPRQLRSPEKSRRHRPAGADPSAVIEARGGSPAVQLQMLLHRLQHAMAVSKRQREMAFARQEMGNAPRYQRREPTAHLDRHRVVLFAVPEVAGDTDGLDIEVPRSRQHFQLMGRAFASGRVTPRAATPRALPRPLHPSSTSRSGDDVPAASSVFSSSGRHLSTAASARLTVRDSTGAERASRNDVRANISRRAKSSVTIVIPRPATIAVALTLAARSAAHASAKGAPPDRP